MNAFTKVAATAVVVPLGLLAMTLPSHAETATVTEECVASPHVPGTPAVTHDEYKFAFYDYQKGVREVPEGYVIKDQRKVTDVAEEREYQYALYETQNGVSEVPDGWKVIRTHIITPEVPETVEKTGWKTTAPEGEGWVVIKQRVVTDVPAVPETPEVSHIEHSGWVLTANLPGWGRPVETKVVVDKEAWDEQVLVKEAWDETVVVSEAWTEKIHHPAVIKHHEAKYEDRVVAKEYKKKAGRDWMYKWFPVNSNTQGWTPTGNVKTEKVLIKEAWDEVIKEAWTEKIHHPEVTKVVHHEAEYKTVHHKAVTHKEYRFEKKVITQPYVPGKPAVTHKEYKYSRTIPGTPAVKTYDVARYQRTGWISAEDAPEGWKQVQERISVEEVSHIEYDVAYYEQTGWVLEAPEGEGWKQIAHEVIVDEEAVEGQEEVVCEPEGETPEVPEEETPVDEEEPATDSPKDEEPVKVDISIPTTIHVKISTLTSEKSPESAPVAKKADVAQATTSTKAAPAKDAALAHTGGPSGLIAGLGLLLAGAGAVIASRRK